MNQVLALVPLLTRSRGQVLRGAPALLRKVPSEAAEQVVETDLNGMGPGKRMIPVISGTVACNAAHVEVVIKSPVHVFQLERPIVYERVFDAATESQG